MVVVVRVGVLSLAFSWSLSVSSLLMIIVDYGGAVSRLAVRQSLFCSFGEKSSDYIGNYIGRSREKCVHSA